MSLTAYAQLAAASKTLYDQSEASTNIHMMDEKSALNAAWTQSGEEALTLYKNFTELSNSTYEEFNRTRVGDNTELMDDILQNVIQEVDKSVVEFILSDKTLDEDLAEANKANAEAWAQIGSDEGTVAVDFILV